MMAPLVHQEGMIHMSTRLAAVCTFFFLSSVLFGERGTLKADGILRVKGADVANATITVVPSGAAAYSFPVGTTNFTLELPLDDTYLVSFERADCPTKQVYFDTRVPLEGHASDFRFPFMVTLQHLSAEDMFAYVGPVGFVRFLQPIVDFGYETVYVAKVDGELRARMDQMRITGIDPKIMLVPGAVLVVDRPRGGGEGTTKPAFAEAGTVAPNVHEVPMMFHVLTAVEAPQPAHLAAAPLVANAIVPPVLLQLPIITRAVEQVVVEPTADATILPQVLVKMPIIAMKAEQSVIDPAAVVALAPAALKQVPVIAMVVEQVVIDPVAEIAVMVVALTVPDVSTSIRSDELLVDARRVVRIVCYTELDGSTREFRKVTQAYGAVNYFNKDGGITERAFTESTTQP